MESVTIPKPGASKLLGALSLRGRAVPPPGVENRLCPRQDKSLRKAVDDLQGSQRISGGLSRRHATVASEVVVQRSPNDLPALSAVHGFLCGDGSDHKVARPGGRATRPRRTGAGDSHRSPQHTPHQNRGAFARFGTMNPFRESRPTGGAKGAELLKHPAKSQLVFRVPAQEDQARSGAPVGRDANAS